MGYKYILSLPWNKLVDSWPFVFSSHSYFLLILHPCSFWTDFLDFVPWPHDTWELPGTFLTAYNEQSAIVVLTSIITSHQLSWSAFVATLAFLFCNVTMPQATDHIPRHVRSCVCRYCEHWKSFCIYEVHPEPVLEVYFQITFHVFFSVGNKACWS